MRLVALLVTLAALPAHAEMWASRLGPFLKTATRIEVIHVGTIRGTTTRGNLVAAIRSPERTGAVIEVDLAGLVTPAAGDDVLVVCDDQLCPRAAGIDDHGAFVLHARELGDGASVTPSLVERASLPALAAGKPAPELCFAGKISLLDDRAMPPFVARLSAAEGTGTGTLDGHALTASMGMNDTTGLALRLGDLQLAVAHRDRGHDGCFDATIVPIHPVPRTRGTLAAASRGAAVASRLATGAFTLPDPTSVATGHHTVELSLDAAGQLVLASDLASGSPRETDRTPDRITIGFATGTGAYPMFGLELAVPTTAATIPPFEVVATFAAILAAKHDVTIEAVWTSFDGRNAVRMSLGSFSLHYLPETAKGRP